MNDQKNDVENVKVALSHSPLELHANIIYTMCRIHIARIDWSCSQLADADELIQIPDKRLELIENIYFDLREIKNILWAAVESSSSGNYQKDSNSEGQL
jgi:hypothetical protein